MRGHAGLQSETAQPGSPTSAPGSSELGPWGRPRPETRAPSRRPPHSIPLNESARPTLRGPKGHPLPRKRWQLAPAFGLLAAGACSLGLGNLDARTSGLASRESPGSTSVQSPNAPRGPVFSAGCPGPRLGYTHSQRSRTLEMVDPPTRRTDGGCSCRPYNDFLRTAASSGPG